MSSPDYVWEKLYAAVSCLCDEGSFVSRLREATVSSIIRLNEDDLDGELAKDLEFIFAWTKNNLKNGEIQNEPDELQRTELIEKILHVMLETNRNTINGISE